MVRWFKSIRIFIDASNEKIAVVKLCLFGYQCFVTIYGYPVTAGEDRLQPRD